MMQDLPYYIRSSSWAVQVSHQWLGLIGYCLNLPKCFILEDWQEAENRLITVKDYTFLAEILVSLFQKTMIAFTLHSIN